MNQQRITSVALGALLMGGLSACGSGQAEEAPSVATAAVERGSLRITAEATGTLEPVLRVEVKSKASGEIFELYADVGDRVDAGTLLAQVDPRDVRNDFEEAEADLDVAQARLEIAQAQRSRSQELLEAGVITEQEHEGRALEYANARAQLVKAQTNLELARLRLSDVTIRAPLAGTILERNVERGQVIQSASQNVSGGTTLLVMANLDQMQVRTLVDETDMGEIQPGMTANVKVEAFSDRAFVGVVEKIEPQAVVQQNVTMFPVIVRLDNRAGLLRPGMNAEVEILIAEAQGVLVAPNNTVVRVQEAAPAAMVLGIDPEELPFSRGARGSRTEGASGPAGAAPAGGGPADGRPGSSADRAADNGSPGAARAGAGGPALDSIRARVQRGEISRDSAQVLFRAQAGARRGGGAADSAGAAPPRQTRPSVVFVVRSDGTFEPRMVQVGLNDWDNTEIVSGVEEGEQLAQIGAAQLQAQQQEFLNRIRERRGGGPF